MDTIPEQTNLEPREYIQKYGTQEYDKHFACLKQHTYIGTCYRWNFSCTTKIEPAIIEKENNGKNNTTNS